jgi:hypothetical protein
MVTAVIKFVSSLACELSKKVGCRHATTKKRPEKMLKMSHGEYRELKKEQANKVVLTLGMLSLVHTPSESSRSRISQAKMDGHSLL